MFNFAERSWRNATNLHCGLPGVEGTGPQVSRVLVGFDYLVLRSARAVLRLSNT